MHHEQPLNAAARCSAAAAMSTMSSPWGEFADAVDDHEVDETEPANGAFPKLGQLGFGHPREMLEEDFRHAVPLREVAHDPHEEHHRPDASGCALMRCNSAAVSKGSRCMRTWGLN